MIQCRDATVSDNFDDFMRMCVHQVGLQVDVIVHLAEVLLHNWSSATVMMIDRHALKTFPNMGYYPSSTKAHECSAFSSTNEDGNVELLSES